MSTNKKKKSDTGQGSVANSFSYLASAILQCSSPVFGSVKDEMKVFSEPRGKDARM